MKRFRLTIGWIIVVGLMFLAGEGIAQPRIVLVHPTVNNLQGLLWLLDHRVIDIPDVELVGLYAADETYDYSETDKYIQEFQLKQVKLIRLDGALPLEAIYKANGLTPSFKQIVAQSDAILFSGGPDIPAKVYGEPQSQLTVVTDPHRHYWETSFFFQLIGGSRNSDFRPLLNDRPDFLVRAFCLGMQTMNVAAGGTLVQDIPDEIYHKKTLEEIAQLPAGLQHRSSISPQYPLDDLFGGCFHPIQITAESYLGSLLKSSGAKDPLVLSYHHQAVGKLGANLTIIARSTDGEVVEGLQHTKFRNVIGVQFHPEADILYRTDGTLTTAPGDSFSPNGRLKQTGSLAFHKAFWSDFAKLVEQNYAKRKGH